MHFVIIFIKVLCMYAITWIRIIYNHEIMKIVEAVIFRNCCEYRDVVKL